MLQSCLYTTLQDSLCLLLELVLPNILSKGMDTLSQLRFVLYMALEKKTKAHPLHEGLVPISQNIMADLQFSLGIHVFGEHLPSIINLKCPVRLLSESLDDKVPHREEDILISPHLPCILSPSRNYRLQPQSLRQ